LAGQSDDGVTVGRVLELEPPLPLPVSDALPENDLLIYQLLHLVTIHSV
jgi:hypothetical protein